jgi:hypothetical protein
LYQVLILSIQCTVTDRVTHRGSKGVSATYTFCSHASWLISLAVTFSLIRVHCRGWTCCKEGAPSPTDLHSDETRKAFHTGTDCGH